MSDSNQKQFMIQRRKRWSVLQLFFTTIVAAVFFAALFSENTWCRATLGTITCAMILNSLLAAVFTQGERRAYSLGYFIGAMFCPVMAYTFVASLPYLITTNFYQFLNDVGAGPLSKENFYIVSGIFWIQLTCICSGCTGLYYSRSMQEKSPLVPKPNASGTEPQ